MLNHSSLGSGIPLVFIHAFPVDRRMWEGNVTLLSRHFRCVTLDLPGFGQSPLIEEDTASMARMAQLIIDTLAQAGIKEKFIPIGLSMGGYVVFQLLKQFPNRIRAAALVSTRAEADSPAAREKRLKNIEMVGASGVAPLAEAMLPNLLGKTTRSTSPNLVQTVQTFILEQNPKAVQAALRGMAEREDSTALCPSISVPVVAMAGEEDVLFTPSDMAKWVKTIPRSEFHDVPKAGHLLNLEQPALFQDLLTTFLKRSVL